MKFLGLVFLLSAAVLWQCEKGVSDARSNRADAQPTREASATPPVAAEPTGVKISNMKEIFNSSGKKDEIEYRIAGKFQKKGQYEGVNYPQDNLVIEYELKNTGAKNYVLYNQGHAGHNREVVYAERLADGTIEVSQKAFAEPKDKTCPATFTAIVPRGSWLKAGESLTDKVYLELPLKNNAPYSFCEPASELPASFEKVKFCLGYQEAARDLKIDEEGNLQPPPDFRNQLLLCTEVGDFK